MNSLLIPPLAVQPMVALLILSILSIGQADELMVNGKRFTVPDGCVIELVAGPSLIDRPISCDFDQLGRLYVTESSGTNENIQEQLRKKPHRIIRLEDTNHDGVFDKRTVFAEQMMFPEGAMFFDGSLYVCAPPQIWKLTDTDDDGKSDRREVWFDGKTLTGCANDLHGPYLGPDGWIYWCKGAFAKQTYQFEKKPDLVTRASHIFRRRPEGGPVEHVMTGGMDNPVELVFTPEGERIFNATFLHHPRDGKRDGLVHALYGGVYGKEHGVLEGHPRTGELMPVMADHDASAPSGLVRLKSAHFGETFRNNVLCSSFNMHKIFRHRLSYNGSLLQTKNEDFVVCHDLDFHPTDVMEDADGSVLIVDTGGWYKLCCPTSQLHKPDVLGAIYRVRRKDAKPAKDPRGLLLDWKKSNPMQWIAEDRFAVRERAQKILSSQNRVQELAAILKDKTANEFNRLQAVWTLCKNKSQSAREASRLALTDASPVVRQAAAHAASVWKDRGALKQLCALLKSDSPMNRRVAAEALGRLGDSRAVPAILDAASELKLSDKTHDRMADRGLEHSLIYALIEIGDSKSLREIFVTSASIGASSKEQIPQKHVAIMALSEIEPTAIRRQQVLQLVRAPNYLFNRTGWWLFSRHPQWGDALADYFRSRFATGKPIDLSRLATVLNRPSIQKEVLSFLKTDVSHAVEQKAGLLQLLSTTKSKLSEEWSSLPGHLLASKDPPLIEATIRWLQSHPQFVSQEIVNKTLLPMARKESADPELRLRTYSICKKTELADTDLSFLAKYLTAEHSVALRGLALDSLKNSTIRLPQRLELCRYVEKIGAGELPGVISLITRGNRPEVNQALLDSLENSKVVSALDPVELTKLLKHLDKDPRLLALTRKITQGREESMKRMDSILAKVPNGDVRRGQKIFHSSKASCIACHQMGYLGGRIGPSLSRIGRIRSERDLLEALMFPSVSFVRSYEPVIVATFDGKQYSGIIKNETTAELELILDANKSVRLNKSEIENRKIGTKSIMPSGLDKQFSDQELADVIRFLKESG